MIETSMLNVMGNDMIEPIKLTLCFLTPAFLGDAEQAGEFRTPPIKAQLRHFWRMVQVAHGLVKVDEVREREHVLFGSASGNTGHQSRVRIRLDEWDRGHLMNWQKLASKPIQSGKNSLPASFYLGYGPLGHKAPPTIAHAPAIDAGASAPLRIAVMPNDRVGPNDRNDIRQALALMHRFGTLGGRSRNGWGSYALGCVDLASAVTPLVDWRQALECDWPTALGRDDHGALLWHSGSSFPTWEKAIEQLAQLRADVNRAGGDRTLLSYPVTKKTHGGWDNSDRLPSSLRFKVVADGDRFRAQVAHFPCSPSSDLMRKGRVLAGELERAWRTVHQCMDGQSAFERVPDQG